MNLKKNSFFFLVFVVLSVAFTELFAQTLTVYNIVDFGANQGENSNAQKAIQDAIDQCSKDGGGTVLVPAGTYYTSTIYLRSKINLQLNNGAMLVAIADKNLYKNEKIGLEDAGDNFIPALIVANKIENFSITGQGTIKGQPTFNYTIVTYKDTYPGWNENAMKSGVSMKRPWVNDPKISLVYISDCKNILLEGISIVDSPNWSCHIQWSQNVRVNGIRITSSLMEGVNSDGLDIDGCKSVIVSNSIIQTGDDAICLKTTKQGARSESCEDILIENCILSSSSCALKIGTESQADFKRITFTNCTISQSNRGIGIIVRDGGIVSDVLISNILMDLKRKPVFWWGNGEAFHLNVFKRNPDSRLGKIENVTLQNIRGSVEGTSSIIGLANGNNTIGNIRLQNIDLLLRKESEKDKRATHAIELLNAAEISVKNVKINWEDGGGEPLWSNAFYVKNVNGLLVEGFRANQEVTQNNVSDILLSDVKNALIQPKSIKEIRVQAEGKHSQNIMISQTGSNLKVINKLQDKQQVKINNQ